MKYKIGRILTSNQDVEVEKALSGEKVVIPKGNKIIIGADKLAHHLRTGMIQPLGTAEVEGYDSEGLAEYLSSKRIFLSTKCWRTMKSQSVCS